MKTIKLSLFNFFMTLLTVSILTPSCTKEKINPNSNKNQDALPSAEFMQQKLAKVNKTTIPSSSRISKLTKENRPNIVVRGTDCIKYNDWNLTKELGWLWAYSSTENWFYSDKYKDFVWIDTHDELCDGDGILFLTNHDICGRSGWLFDFDAAESTLWHWQNNAWGTLGCSVCDNNDYSSRFMELITNYSYLEGSAASSGLINYYNDMVDFRDLVQTGAPLDIKNTDAFLSNLGDNRCGVTLFGREVAVDVPGNILYGFLGHLYWKNKYPNDTGLFLGAAAGLAQSISDGNGDSFSAALLLIQDDWLFLTSGDPWCDTYAVYFGVDMASDHGANITTNQFTTGIRSSNTWLNDPFYRCPAPYSPTGWCEDGTYGPCN